MARMTFMCACATGLLEGRDFVVERLPAATEYVRARNYDVDLLSARLLLSDESRRRARPTGRGPREIR